MNSAAYVRVSSRGQDLATQRDAIRRAAAARGDTIVRWFSEKRSAAKLDRPELAALRAAVRRGEVTKVWAFRLDRLTRSGIRDTLALVDELRCHGASVSTVADGFDLDGPASDVVLAVLAWAAQMERAALSERISAARLRVEASGGRWGRPRAVDPALVACLRAAAKANPGRSQRDLSVEFGVARSTLQRILAQKGHYQRRPVRREK